MKVSVFNDDKKTELIGETWVNLQEVVVTGGGQNDLWHNLSYKGKYAGEIRIEITYYDTRPKQEKASEKTRPSVPNGATDGARDVMTGPREPKPAPKRRPLPADPTSASQSPTATPPQFQTPPRGYQVPQAYIHTQSPLQAVEYSTPPQKLSQSQQGYRQNPASTGAYATPPGMIAVTPTGRPMQDEIYDPQENYDSGHQGRYEDQAEDRRRSSKLRYDPYEVPSELPVPFEYKSLPNPDGPPPPPPAHRSSHVGPAGAAQQSKRQYEEAHLNTVRNVSFGTSQQDGFRHSMPAYGQPTSYQAYKPPQTQDGQASYPENNSYQDPPPRAHSYDGRFSENYRSMQPTVEDDLPSPTNQYPSTYRNKEQQSANYDDRRYDQIPPTAPLNLSGRGSAASGQYNASSGSNQQYYAAPSSSVSPVSYREPSHMGSEVSSQTSYSQLSQQSHRSQNQINQSDDYESRSPGGYVPPLPPTLVAGMDPMIAQEVSERIYTENRAMYSQNGQGSSRNHYSEQPSYHQSYPHPHRQETAAFVPAASSSSSSSSAVPFVSAAATYDDRQSRMSTNSYAPVIKPRALSPDTRVPARKSVSPSPGPSSEERRLSGVPFGPDAYNALNPNVSPAAQAANPQPSFKVDGQHHSIQVDDFDSSAKIILYDGREVDPSDHLPETSWAPEPESRGHKQPDSTRTRPTLGGAQPMPSSGSRLPRQTARPHSMGAVPPSLIQPTGGFSEPPAPASRNRLQKKSNRGYGAPAAHSSPLAPISSYQDNSFTPKGLPRPQTLDFAGENGYGSYGSGKGGNQGGYARNSGAGPPPVPAKVPMNRDHGSAPLPPTENAWALLEEMKTIDLGGGRSRRRGDYNRAFA